MVANVAVKSSGDLSALLSEITRELINTGIDDNDGIIALPSTYPSGATVIIRIRRDRERFIVSDGGYGYVEAEHMGGAQTFSRIAQAEAVRHGVKFDGQMVFAVEVSRDRLASAIIFTGAASRKSVEITADKLSEEREAANKDRLRSLIKEAFKEQASFDVAYPGRSTKRWRFDAMVRRPERWTLFDLVTPHHVSINSTIVKFQDVAQLEDGPHGVAVLTNRKAMDSADISLISGAAGNVITLESSFEELRMAA